MSDNQCQIQLSMEIGFKAKKLESEKVQKKIGK